MRRTLSAPKVSATAMQEDRMRYQVNWFATIRFRTDVNAPTLNKAKQRVNEVLTITTQSTVGSALDRAMLNDGLNRQDVHDITVSQADLLTDVP